MKAQIPDNITLRDFLASQTLNQVVLGLISNQDIEAEIARRAYSLADAMLRERDKAKS